MEKKKLGTSKGVETIKFVLNICGLWSKKKLRRWSTVLYNFYGLNILVIFLFLYDLSLSVYVIFIEDVQEATNNLCMTLTLITLFGKVLNFKIHLTKIQNLLLIGEEFELNDELEISLVNQRISFYNKLTIFLYGSANIAGCFIYTGALLSGEKKLPFLGWYPFDWKSDFTSYVLLYLYQCIGMIIQSNLNVTMDLFSAYLMYVGSIKLEILGKRLEKLSKFQEQGQLNLSMDNETKKQHISSLVQCVNTYQHIWKYTQWLQKYFTYGFLIQISFSGTVICSIAYQLTTTSPREDFALYIFMIMFQTCMITQIALPCYFGNEIILRHENLKKSAFESGWHLQSMEHRRIVIIFMELMKKKQSILVGNWFDLDLDLFTSIMNFAYRLYALLV